MKVLLRSGSGNESVAVLKLYDRRYFPDIRESLGVSSNTSAREAAYLQFVLDGEATQFVYQGHDSHSDDSAWKTGE